MQRINLTDTQKSKLSTILDGHDTYEKFSRTRIAAFEYTSTLGVRVCPYCNINYTYTVYEKKNSAGPGGAHKPVARPDLDHFEAKSKNRKLSLALENLIPCCTQCNSRIKAQKKFSSKTHIHPFLDDFDSIKRFSIDLKDPDLSSRQSLHVTFENRFVPAVDIKRADQSIRDLKLIHRYQYHREEVVDLLQRARFYHTRKIQELEDLAETANLHRHLFSDVTAKLNTVPLSKLKNDILELVLPK